MAWYQTNIGGGSGETDGIKEVFISRRQSGAGTRFIFISPETTSFGNDQSIITSADSEYFTIGSSFLTAKKAVKIRSTVNGTSAVIDMAIGDTVRYYDGGAFNTYIISVLS